MRRDPPQHFALHQRFANEPELEIFQITQTAMDELGRRRRSAAGEIVLFAEVDGKAPPSGVAGDPAAVDAASNDGEIINDVHVSSGRPPQWSFRFFR